jgi:hypothetical protein
MKQRMNWRDSSSLNIRPTLRPIYWLGGFVCIVFIVYSVITLLLFVVLNPPPDTVEEYYNMLNANKFIGLLRLDILTVFIVPFYFVLIYSLFEALNKTNPELTLLSTILVFAGITAFLATPSAFSYLHLSEKFAAATSELERNQLITAGETLFASDMLHGKGTGVIIGGLLTETGILALSIIMLNSNVFNKVTAYTGIVTHGLDLIHILIGLFFPSIGVTIMAIAGTLYLLWFPLLGVRLFKLSKLCIKYDN